MFKKIILGLVSLLIMTHLSVSQAQRSSNDTELLIKKQIETVIPPDWKIDSISAAPYGLYQVIITMDAKGVQRTIFYTNDKAEYLMSGALLDTKTREDYAATARNLLFFDDQDAYKDLAITQVRGNGSRRVVIFEDPNCVYCKKLHTNIAELNDVTIQTILMPIFGEDSKIKTQSILCSNDPSKTFDQWMRKNITPPQANCPQAASMIERALELSKLQRVTGTPTIYFANGQRVPGAIEFDDFKQLLADTPQGSAK